MQLNARHNVGAQGQVAPTLAASSAAGPVELQATHTPAALHASVEDDTQIDPSATSCESLSTDSSFAPAPAAASASSPQLG
eukprot:2671534-Amphidinium_carterae.1